MLLIQLKPLRKHVKNAKKKEILFIYNWATRNTLENSLSLTSEEVQQRLTRGDAYVVSFLKMT